MAILGTCNICHESQAKYKCSKCSVQYCSLPCFKSPEHNHDSIAASEESASKSTVEVKIPADSRYQDIFQNEKFKYLLSFKSLQIHLASINDILKDPTLTQEKKMDQANDKLTSLRTTGSNENELVEEFCQLITQLLSPTQS